MICLSEVCKQLAVSSTVTPTCRDMTRVAPVVPFRAVGWVWVGWVDPISVLLFVFLSERRSFSLRYGLRVA